MDNTELIKEINVIKNGTINVIQKLLDQYKKGSLMKADEYEEALSYADGYLSALNYISDALEDGIDVEDLGFEIDDIMSSINKSKEIILKFEFND